MNDASGSFEPLEKRLERVSRNLTEAADELQRLVDVLWRDVRPPEGPAEDGRT